MCKRFMSLAVFLLITLSLTACMGITFTGGNAVIGSGKVVSETRNVSGYDRVVIAGSGDAAITVGDGEGMTIEAEDNILPYIETTVQGSRLVIGMKPNTSISTMRGIRYIINAKALNGAEITGSGSISVNPVKSDNFQMNISGSGSIKLAELRGKSLKATLTGSGKLDVVSGEVESQDVTLSGSGSFSGENLKSSSAQVVTTGSGSATVWVKDTLKVTTSGSGNVRYYGQPTVTKTETGSGRVTGLGNK